MTDLVVVDSSVWIEHFRRPDAQRANRIGSLTLRLHEFVLGELILGYLARTDPAFQMLSIIPCVTTMSHDEVVEFVRAHRLEGAGIGWADAHILAATEASDAALWTLDRTLLATAMRAGVGCLA